MVYLWASYSFQEVCSIRKKIDLMSTISIQGNKFLRFPHARIKSYREFRKCNAIWTMWVSTWWSSSYFFSYVVSFKCIIMDIFFLHLLLCVLPSLYPSWYEPTGQWIPNLPRQTGWKSAQSNLQHHQFPRSHHWGLQFYDLIGCNHQIKIWFQRENLSLDNLLPERPYLMKNTGYVTSYWLIGGRISTLKFCMTRVVILVSKTNL